MVWSRTLYRWLTDDDGEARACEAIPEEACEHVPRSFVLNAANGACTKLAEQLASPGLVLAWLLETVAAPIVLIGWLEPIRQGGSLLPQLVVSAQIRARPVRKWFWVVAGATQAVALALVAAAALMLTGVAAGTVVIGLLAVFSVASGIGSVAFSDVVGKTIPKGKRGQLLAVRASVGGALTLGAGIALRIGGGERADVGLYALLIGVAALLWAAAALLFAAIPERPGATGGGRNALSEVRDAAGLVRREAGFRRFLLARALLLPLELAVPFYALHSRRLGLVSEDLGVAIIAVGVANMLSSPIWGRVADRVSSRWVMILGGITSAVATLVALGLDRWSGGTITGWAYAPVFFLAGLAIAGARIGRKTYLVDATEERTRSLYVSLSNTLMGALTFAYGALGLIAEFAGVEELLGVLLVFGLVGAGAARLAPDPESILSSTAPARGLSG